MIRVLEWWLKHVLFEYGIKTISRRYQDNCTKSFLKNPTREVPEIPYSWECDGVAEIQPKNLMLVIMASEVCVRHKLEGVQVELSHLAGCQATDELVQRHHVRSSQLLRCQSVMFGHSLPDRPHLHSWDTLIIDQRYINKIFMSTWRCLCFITCDSFQPQQPISSRLSSKKGSFSRFESTKPWNIHPICVITLSLICSMVPNACRHTQWQ